MCSIISLPTVPTDHDGLLGKVIQLPWSQWPRMGHLCSHGQLRVLSDLNHSPRGWYPTVSLKLIYKSNLLTRFIMVYRGLRKLYHVKFKGDSSNLSLGNHHGIVPEGPLGHGPRPWPEAIARALRHRWRLGFLNFATEGEDAGNPLRT